MPKDTFYNLSDEKKKRIFDAAVQEFSTRRFSEASLNQIVKAAKIPWGSFYQYFNDKEDIYLYMLEEIGKDKRKNVPYTEALDPDADVFETIIQKSKESLELGRVKPEYTKIGMLMEIDNSEFITKLRVASAEKYMKMIERDKERGLIKPEIDSELVMNMIFTFGLNEYFRSGLDENRYLKKLNDAIKIIKEGISMFKD
ncbi:MAG: HTH-type transcriptional regulator SrpR [Pelotomaculum sp. PtaB.Bin013]|uniref:TetR/AcrR family transcriptional regulator n=1 Tax=Pelotomaculum isophthalicicum JI TaxID=947010 RepID=A0A9X4GYN8_9FIRM|nr:TetR/AcrR family transcriptional regulator [Pelotomaculum isophthalicicum]MDF9408000.1 TetR/AcrR family transcriptional regulator [Pelotomaculum isophthalicicum JI]OPX83143.1 MAG: HTH-type transcriptional regulator SrpR [Pelotomaculum sp. PtaB.Bin013]